VVDQSDQAALASLHLTTEQSTNVTTHCINGMFSFLRWWESTIVSIVSLVVHDEGVVNKIETIGACFIRTSNHLAHWNTTNTDTSVWQIQCQTTSAWVFLIFCPMAEHNFKAQFYMPTVCSHLWQIMEF